MDKEIEKYFRRKAYTRAFILILLFSLSALIMVVIFQSVFSQDTKDSKTQHNWPIDSRNLIYFETRNVAPNQFQRNVTLIDSPFVNIRVNVQYVSKTWDMSFFSGDTFITRSFPIPSDTNSYAEQTFILRNQQRGIVVIGVPLNYPPPKIKLWDSVAIAKNAYKKGVIAGQQSVTCLKVIQ